MFLLRKYSKTEQDRMKIYKELLNSTISEYSEQTIFGNTYNMNIEVLMSNPFFVRSCKDGDMEYLNMLKNGLSKSFDESIDFVVRE